MVCVIFSIHGCACESQLMRCPGCLFEARAVRRRPRTPLLEAIGRGTRADSVLGYPGRDGHDLPTITVEAAPALAEILG
jgi:hypothetical protein